MGDVSEREVRGLYPDFLPEPRVLLLPKTGSGKSNTFEGKLSSVLDMPVTTPLDRPSIIGVLSIPPGNYSVQKMGRVSLGTAGCLFLGCGWLEVWVGRWRGGGATTRAGLVSILLWFWASRWFLWTQSCYRSLMIGLSDCSQRESQELGSALCC